MNKHQKNQQQDIRGWPNESDSEMYQYALTNILRRKTTLGTLPKISDQPKKTPSKRSHPKLPLFEHHKKQENVVSTTNTSPEKKSNIQILSSKDSLKPLKLKLQEILNQEQELKDPSPETPAMIMEDTEEYENSLFTTERKQKSPTAHITGHVGLLNHKKAQSILTDHDQEFKKCFQRYDIEMRSQKPLEMTKTQSNKYLKLHTLDMSKKSKNIFFQNYKVNPQNHHKSSASTHETLQQILKSRHSRQKLQTLDKIEKINQKMRQTFVRQDNKHRQKKKTLKKKDTEMGEFNDDVIFTYNNSLNMLPQGSLSMHKEQKTSKIITKISDLKPALRYKLILY